MAARKNPKYSRREVLKIAAGAGAAAAVPPQIARSATTTGASATGRSGDSRPHILLLMSDQHRGDCLGADGNSAIRTPNLDELARDGARFRQAYSAVPSCSPARAALLTGLDPWNNGMLGMGGGWPIPPHYRTELPQMLKDAGYATTGIGKMEFGPMRNTGHGFDQMLHDETSLTFRTDYRSWFLSHAPTGNPLDVGPGLDGSSIQARVYPFPEHLHRVRWTGETAVRFIRSYHRPQPFFLKVSFIPPHPPYTPPNRFFQEYLNADLPKAVQGNWEERYKPRSGPGWDIWHGDLGAAQVHWSRTGYYGSVSFVDEQIGRILEALDQRGWLEQTVILYTSDHGDMLGDHHLWRKCQPYQPSVRIPLLVRWPKGMVSASRGQVFSQIAELRDVLPTLVEAAGGPAPENIDGRSLFSLIRGETEGWRDTLELEHSEIFSPTIRWNALTDGRVKYIFHAYKGWEQLFDLDRDPEERIDLAPNPAYAKMLKLWRERMVASLEKRGPAYVRNGKLMTRNRRMSISPNYPKEEMLKFLHQHGIKKFRYIVPRNRWGAQA